MNRQTVDLLSKAKQIKKLWSPKIVAQLNDYHIKLARVQGEFVWHSHGDTDEAFLILQGKLTIQFRDSALTLKTGELYVVPRGVEHRPVADEECLILLIEPEGTVNTGDAGGDRTAPHDSWI